MPILGWLLLEALLPRQLQWHVPRLSAAIPRPSSIAWQGLAVPSPSLRASAEACPLLKRPPRGRKAFAERRPRRAGRVSPQIQHLPRGPRMRRFVYPVSQSQGQEHLFGLEVFESSVRGSQRSSATHDTEGGALYSRPPAEAAAGCDSHPRGTQSFDMRPRDSWTASRTTRAVPPNAPAARSGRLGRRCQWVGLRPCVASASGAISFLKMPHSA